MNDEQLARLLGELQGSGLTLATAESLTGGALASRVVDVPGASNTFRGGVVTYASDTKVELLGVDSRLIADGGPVQAQVAAQMAQGVTRLFNADVGVSTTGVAGPGDTADGPSGLVFIGAHFPEGTRTEVHRFSGSREQVRAQSVNAALCFLHLVLLEHLGQ